MHWIYYTSFAGGRTFTRPTPSPKRLSPTRPFWITFASRTARNRGPPRIPSTAAYGSWSVLCDICFPMRLPRSRGFQHFYWRRSALGYGRPRPALSRLRVKVPQRVVIPLSIDEVARFWSSFQTSRDLAIVGMMLLQGLRSCEVLALNRDDLILSEAQIRVLGKGNRVRLLPLAPETIELLDHYLRLERPTHCGS